MQKDLLTVDQEQRLDYYRKILRTSGDAVLFPLLQFSSYRNNYSSGEGGGNYRERYTSRDREEREGASSFGSRQYDDDRYNPSSRRIVAYGSFDADRGGDNHNNNNNKSGRFVEEAYDHHSRKKRRADEAFSREDSDYNYNYSNRPAEDSSRGRNADRDEVANNHHYLHRGYMALPNINMSDQEWNSRMENRKKRFSE